ncbi:MAG: hypothetical protein WA941_03465 [Nitrososphaeraceae archaeon]
MIVLQLKSSSDGKQLLDIGNIISVVKKHWGYRIRGHEIHQRLNLEKSTPRDRARLVSSFCSKNDIEYVTYHAPIPRNEGQSLFDERSNEKANNSLLATLLEAELVHTECGLKDKVVIVYHLPSVIGFDESLYLNRELKFKILENSERELLGFQDKKCDYFDGFATLTVENVFPKYFTTAGTRYSTINMFHPSELIRLGKFGIGITFDFSHYNIYRGCLSTGDGNAILDLDKQIYGTAAPSWEEFIDVIGKSLRQLHINDGKGTYPSGEGLMLGEGEIPVVSILRHVHYGLLDEMERIVQGTIELVNGHLYGGKLQKRALEWLLVNAEDIFQ